MMKKILNFLCIIFCAFFFMCGCSKSDIKDITLDETSFAREYVVLEDVMIDEIKIIVVLRNNEKKEYTLRDTSFSYEKIDNSEVGIKKFILKVNYKNVNYSFNTSITFINKEEVITIINKIDELCDRDFAFSNKMYIDEIDNMYNELDDKYKKYVQNYNEFEQYVNEYNSIRNTYITDEILSQRIISINNLENYVNTLDSSNYSMESWDSILLILDTAKNEILNDNNYNLIDTIVANTVNSLKSVLTLEEENLLMYKESKNEQLESYVESKNMTLYSEENYSKFNQILSECLVKINNANNENGVNSIYSECYQELLNVKTIEEEKTIALNNLRKSKEYEARQQYLNIDIRLYDDEGINALNEKLNACISSIYNSIAEEEMDEYIEKFKRQIKRVLTIKEKQELTLKQNIENALLELEDYYNEINIYSYDSTNRAIIDSGYEETKEKIENSSYYEDLNEYINEYMIMVEGLLTMQEQYAMLTLGV